MRRIYESDALHRDDEPFTPREKDSSYKIQAMRSVDSTALSRRVLPQGLRHRAVSVTVSTPQEEYAVGEPIPFRVTLRNPLPAPVAIPTRSPLLWAWKVDGFAEAAEIQLHDPPDEEGELVLDRGERKRVTKRWDQLFRVSDSEWEPAEPGEHTISAEINVEDPVGKGLAGETTVRIVPEEEAERTETE
ncbi:hypothetical protein CHINAEXTREME_19650 [Halobiforma lacisalsi AJ5]|uniref:DUF7974 domain-containing protein n=1 Tax=Natronobacterium lacisalsi AJ5 TaxID=358396 RepID=M0LR50_NATLA|nr:hypothetical protein [Halobiforma lacisalsi]APW99848.1 hypothetical protein CHINAEXTREME_19650 [Halobiforma lacisalsi AJ5]EMA35971.1 hypothetical protein C445_03908 [Halobiforma lacisalsi AJ5]